MTKLMLLAAPLFLLAGPARAGDAALGEDLFRKCKACHSIIATDGTEIQKGGRTGPNLYGVMGRRVASDPDFSYGEALQAAGAAGAVWDEGSFAGYVADPDGWVQQATGDAAADSKMSFALSDGAADVAAYLESVSH